MERHTFLNALLDLFYPPRCIWCHRFLNDEEKREGVCCSCSTSLPVLIRGERCRQLPEAEICTSLLQYKGEVRQSILRYKFRGLSFYSSFYADLMADVLDREEYACDVITWVPLSRKRLRKRGYDQAKLLAEDFARKTGYPCEALLKKVRNTAPQSGTAGKEERKTNIRDAYLLMDGKDLAGKTVLLIDDIVTTGATLSECASVLRKGGAERVKALTLARTDLEKRE